MAKILQIPAVETLRRIQRIQAITIVWMSIEAAVSLSAGWIARSPALLAFGGDSAIELLSAVVVLWRFRAHERGPPPCNDSGRTSADRTRDARRSHDALGVLRRPFRCSPRTTLHRETRVGFVPCSERRKTTPDSGESAEALPSNPVYSRGWRVS